MDVIGNLVATLLVVVSHVDGPSSQVAPGRGCVVNPEPVPMVGGSKVPSHKIMLPLDALVGISGDGSERHHFQCGNQCPREGSGAAIGAFLHDPGEEYDEQVGDEGADGKKDEVRKVSFAANSELKAVQLVLGGR